MPTTMLTPAAQRLPLPVLFHPLKHHLATIREFVRADLTNPAPVKAALLTLGHSNPDIYAGHLTTGQLVEEIRVYLRQQNALDPAPYKAFLAAQGSDYSLTTLSDGSAWVLRWGKAPGRHVHIHPARHAPHTIRAKATILKTAIAATLESRITGATIDLKLINHARHAWLNLPPIATLQPGPGIANLLKLLHSA